MSVVRARATIMTGLGRCPVCGAAVLEAETSDNLETVAFECEAAFYLQTGSTIAVSRICGAPTYVAVRHLESEAVDLAAAFQSVADMAAKEAA